MRFLRLFPVRVTLLAVLIGPYTHISLIEVNRATETPSFDFTRQIRPILSENCFACHGPDDKKRKAGLRLDLKVEAFKKLKSDAYAIVPGNLEKSELIRRITTDDDDEKMPPPKSGKHLAPQQVDLLRRWVSAGAEYKDHWAYIAPERVPIPAVRLKNWPRNPIDYFILAKIEQEGLFPAAEAAPEVLIRRATLDLTGLPPTVEEVDRFVHDNRPEAYAQLVETLLASPRYGERWARPWLDQARYADSNGYEADFRRSIWPYRDWVINALNRDLPFDQFTVEQLAGDLLPNATREQKIATGFHRNTMVNTEGGTDDEEFRTAALVDRVNATFGVFMGTTIGCAQCHNHKYDPFTQREYYQLLAFFNQTKDRGRSNEPELELPTGEQVAKRAEVRAQIEPLERALNTETTELDASQLIWESDLKQDLDRVNSSWRSLIPNRFAASDGVSLRRLNDQSLLSSGALPETSTYEITVDTDLQNITAFRLEALADERLPHRSCGRSEEGDFVLTEFTVQAFPLGRQNASAAVSPRINPWKVLGPFHSGTSREAFSHEFISESKVDLTETFEKGTLRWTERTDLADAKIHELSGGANSTTYLYRTITTIEATPLLISLGSDDGVQVWLNGKRVLSRQVERSVARDQDLLELQLAEGENQLLLKVNNGEGDYAFYFAVSEDQTGVGRIPFETAYADASMEKYEVQNAVDGKQKTGWSIGAYEPANRVDHEAVFVAKQPLGFIGGTRLLLKLKQESDRSQHLLGRFRLAVSDASGDSHRALAKLPASIRRALAVPAEELNEAVRKELAGYYRSIDPSLDKVRERVEKMRKQEPNGFPTTLVMAALATNRATHILIRGSHLNPGDEVWAGTPTVLHPWPVGQPTNRLGFARWLTDPTNPLIGRVIINRLWTQYFGRGLVETSEEFGSQGELPTHPELLDWLATEFIRTGWSQKAMHRLIALSSTYRQGSEVTRVLLERDPFNRLLARGSRFRMEAEMLRDNALAIGGILDEKIGGPSVFPFQPDGVWNSPYNGDRWVTSKAGDQFRRGLYTFWRRTAPYASFGAFDAPSREVMCERRAHSNTPIQALVTLNDPAFVAAANGLARRVLAWSQATTVSARLAYACKCCLSRDPTPSEAHSLLRLYAITLDRFAGDPSAAERIVSIGLPKHEQPSRLAELAAWVVISNVLLNLDETLTKS